MKLFLFSLLGAMLGFAVAFAVFPPLSTLLVGPVVSDDHMNENVTLFLILASLLMIAGALMGSFYLQLRINQRKRR